MKILYSAGNRVGANSQLCRFLTNLSPEHTVRVAAYVKSSHSLPHIDWTLDALHHNVIPKSQAFELKGLFGHAGVPLVNLDNVTIFLVEIADFKPDIVICDMEPIAAHIAQAIEAELWYCSPIHLLDGVEWDRGQLRYLSKLDQTRDHLAKLPEPTKRFVYSPFGDVAFRPILKEGYEWVPPYHVTAEGSHDHDCLCVINDFNRFGALTKIINSSDKDIALISPYDETFSNIKHYGIENSEEYKKLLGGCSKIINTGETSYVADAIYNNKIIHVAPTLNDPETLLNAILVQEYGVGSDLSQIELMDKFALDKTEEALEKVFSTDILSKQNRLCLHERI